MTAANDSLRCIGIGRDSENPKALVLYFTGEPSDEDMRRIHELVRAGGPREWIEAPGDRLLLLPARDSRAAARGVRVGAPEVSDPNSSEGA